MSLTTEKDRLSNSLREIRAQIEVEGTRLNVLKKRKPKATEKIIKEDSILRGIKVNIDIERNVLKNTISKKESAEAKNRELERVKENLVKTNERLLTNKMDLVADLSVLEDKLNKEYLDNEVKISERLDEIEKMSVNYSEAVKDLCKERVLVRKEIESHIVKKKEIEKDKEEVLELNVEARMKLKKAEEEYFKAAGKQKSWERKIGSLKNEEKRIEIVRLRVLKLINENKVIEELEELRKELK